MSHFRLRFTLFVAALTILAAAVPWAALAQPAPGMAATTAAALLAPPAATPLAPAAGAVTGAVTGAGSEVVLFSGGYYDAQQRLGWAPRFGIFTGSTTSMTAVAGDPVGEALSPVHAEAQLYGVIGTNFTYAADVVVNAEADIHLQFRISDQGRYGVELRPETAIFYRFARQYKTCNAQDAAAFTHCPDWPEPRCDKNCDDPQWIPIAMQQGAWTAGIPHHLVVEAQGPQFRIAVDGVDLFGGPVTDGAFAVGRFGVYALGTPDALPKLAFSNLRISTDPTRAANFALLYSTAGYEAAGTKRALVRTLNDLPASALQVAGAGAGAEQSSFTLTRDDGAVAAQGPLEVLPTPVGGQTDTASMFIPWVAGGTAAPQSVLQAAAPASERVVSGAKTFGMQLWEADFSAVTVPGIYTLAVDFVTTAGTNHLQSAPFEIRPDLISDRMLKPMSYLNAQARRAADDDMRRNWQKTAGAWSVAVDGAFVADHADAGAGAVLTRIFDDNNWPLYATDFRLMGEVTIVSGCDAQLQFRITDTERWAVTLQAGAGGGCAFGGGPGAVRLSYEGPSGFKPLASNLFPAGAPLQAGRPYRVEILAVGDAVTVWVDDSPRLISIPVSVPAQDGRFALKAWAATARFDRVQAWAPGVTFWHRQDLQWDGLPIPTFANWNDASHQASSQIPCQSFATLPNGQIIAHDPVDKAAYHDACNPLFAQLHGFHDANNVIGEATSHGLFLAGMLHVWQARAYTFAGAEREALREAIQANAQYLELLYQEGSARGEFAHTEMGRGGADTNLGPWQSLFALYGMSAFADTGVTVDKGLARLACSRALDGAQWLEGRGYFGDPAARAVIYLHLARCAAREQLAQCDGGCQQAAKDKALAAADAVLTYFATPGALGSNARNATRSIPWFEGVYELARSDPALRDSYQPRLNAIAELLVTHLTKEHACDDMRPAGARCAANGFYVLPQASGDAPNPWYNWVEMETVPRVEQPTQVKYVHFYNAGHFTIVAADAIYLGLLTQRRDLEPVATGNLYWLLGLNPGIPADKVARGPGGSGGPWQAAAFIYNLPAPFARTFQSYRIESTAAKGWLGAWEGGPASPQRETWWVDPLNNGFESIVNGHVLWDGEWDYWNSGQFGWASGETFILYDGMFLQAAILLEDWLAPRAPAPGSPYDTTKLTFFDTSHLDRADTGWGFDDPNWSEAATAARAATEFCAGKGFGGGRFTGHQIGERVGLLCVPAAAAYFDATAADIAATGWDFQDINQTHWAQVARAATGFCNARGYVGGFFSGHQLNGLKGITCLDSSMAQWFDATEQDLYNSGEGFGDINTLAWGKGARGATNICLGKGFAGGFMTGHRVPGFVGVVCLGPRQGE